MRLCPADRCVSLQDIASSEAELTKRRVQVSAGGKQADKMTRDAAKTHSDLDKASADMQAKQQDFKVGLLRLSKSPGLALSQPACSAAGPYVSACLHMLVDPPCLHNGTGVYTGSVFTVTNSWTSWVLMSQVVQGNREGHCLLGQWQDHRGSCEAAAVLLGCYQSG